MAHRRVWVLAGQGAAFGHNIWVEAQQSVERPVVGGDGVGRTHHRNSVLIGECGSHRRSLAQQDLRLSRHRPRILTIPIGFNPNSPPAYPVNLLLAGAPVLVVGGGPVALRKVAGLLESGASVTVIAPHAVDELVARDEVNWRRRRYRYGDAAAYRLVISATGIRKIDEKVYRDAVDAGVPVNVADVPQLCTFTLPAIVRRGDVQVAVSTNGRSPALASWLRDRLAESVPDAIGDALDLVAEVRTELKAAGQSTEIIGWHDAFDAGFVQLVANGEHAAARRLLRDRLGLAVAS